MNAILRRVRGLVRSLGYDVVRYRPFPSDLTREEIADYLAVKAYTTTGIERVTAAGRAAEYVSRHGVPGDIVECGVWRAGTMMAVARRLLRLNDPRRLLLFDTYGGMTEPGPRDGPHALQAWQSGRREGPDRPCHAPLAEARANMYSTGYPADKIVFVEGAVEQTLPAHAPERIAVLRLATAWYASTHCELVHLYPRLAPRGVLILNDYGLWPGCREAVDGYLRDHAAGLFLARVDSVARIAVKTG